MVKNVLARLNARGFAQEFFRLVCSTDLLSLKTHSKSSSLHLKKNFAWGMRVFRE